MYGETVCVMVSFVCDVSRGDVVGARETSARDVGSVDGRRARVCEDGGGARRRRARVVCVVVVVGVWVEDVARRTVEAGARRRWCDDDDDGDGDGGGGDARREARGR